MCTPLWRGTMAVYRFLASAPKKNMVGLTGVFRGVMMSFSAERAQVEVCCLVVCQVVCVAVFHPTCICICASTPCYTTPFLFYFFIPLRTHGSQRYHPACGH